jgi:cell division protein ZapA
MAQITVTINGRSYPIVCDDGQEAHLSRLARYIDQRASELVAAVGQTGEARLLVMVSLLMADELSDAYAEVKRLGGAGGDGAAATEGLASALDTLAKRIETIAERLERA